MKILVLEDETIAAQRLVRQLGEVIPEGEVVAVLQSVEEAIEWWGSHKEPDVAFMDIHLADGSVFHLFDNIEVSCPIIFTTAYDKYALEAFRVNSVDYLLKPIVQEDLQRAVNKLHTLYGGRDGGVAGLSRETLEGVLSMMQQAHHRYKTSFLIPYGSGLMPIAIEDIACVYLENKVSVFITMDGKSYAVDKSLDAVMQDLDPQHFFRANRQYIIAHQAVQDISFWLGNKLKLRLVVPTPETIILSKITARRFKDWYAMGH